MFEEFMLDMSFAFDSVPHQEAQVELEALLLAVESTDE